MLATGHPEMAQEQRRSGRRLFAEIGAAAPDELQRVSGGGPG
jgi:hypothetical protein